MATETVENYLKAVYTLSRESPTGEAAMSRIAAILGVTTGTATAMVKKLAAGGEAGGGTGNGAVKRGAKGGVSLVRYERFGGVRLTPRGEKAALDILRRHRLIETFLVETLKLDWSVVHAEAERLEHAVSPVVLAALDAHLHHPASDPHGDPIPDAAGKTRGPRGTPLASFRPNSKVRILRITDQDAAFLSFVARHGLKPGTRATVLAVDGAAQSLTVQARGGAGGGHAPVVMALSAAARILCEASEK